MREIKFRAWDKKLNRWLYKNEVGVLQQEFIEVDTKRQFNIFRVFHDYYLTDVEFMQYTGLKDKNGKEIYEGDILVSVLLSWNEKTKKHDIPSSEIYQGVVTYGKINKETGITGHGEGNGNFSFVGFYCKDGRWVNDLCDGMKIIGNIYENPELLNRHC